MVSTSDTTSVGRPGFIDALTPTDTTLSTILSVSSSISNLSSSTLHTSTTANFGLLTFNGTQGKFFTSGSDLLPSDRNVSGFFTAAGNRSEFFGGNGSSLLSTGSAESSIQRIIEASILSVIAAAALIGNVSLWIIICRERSLKTTSNALILCLSTADLLVSAINMPTTVMAILYGHWPLSAGACVVLGFITMTTFIASVMSLGVISINRFVLICYPVHFKLLYTPCRTALMITGTWVLSLLLACPPLLGWGVYDYLAGQSFCFCDWTTSVSYTIFMVVVCFGGPVTVMTICYLGILRKFRASRRKVLSSSLYSETNTAQLQDTLPDDVTTNRAAQGFQAVSPQSQNQEAKRVTHLVNVQGIEDGLLPEEVGGGSITIPGGLEDVRKQVQNSGTQVRELEKNIHVNSGMAGELLSPRGVRIDTGHGAFPDSVASQREGARSAKTALTEAWASPQHGFNNVNTIVDKTSTFPKESAKVDGMEKAKPDTCVPAKKDRVSGTLATVADKQNAIRLRKRGQEDMRLTLTLLVIIFIFIICWLPFCVTMFMAVFSPYPVPRIPDILTLLLGCFNSSCNPVVYGIMNKRFWNGYKRLFCCICRKCRGTDIQELNQTVPRSFQETLQ